jgi:hypothetical protein
MEVNDSQCYAVTLNNQRCKNNTIKGSKWCAIHFDSCQAKRKAYKKSCEKIKDDKIKCRPVDVSNISLSQIDSIINDYRKLINLSNRCLQSREDFEDLCIIDELQNKGHIDFKNRLEIKKTKCENYLTDIVTKRSNLLSINKDSDSSDSDNNKEIISPVKSKKTKVAKKETNQEDLDDIISQFLKQDAQKFKAEKDIINEYKQTFTKLFDQVDEIGQEYIKKQIDVIKIYKNNVDEKYIKWFLNADKEEAKEIVLNEIVSNINKKIKDERMKEYMQLMLNSLFTNFNKNFKSKYYKDFTNKDYNKKSYPDLDIKFQDIENVRSLISYLNVNFVRLYKDFLNDKAKVKLDKLKTSQKKD